MMRINHLSSGVANFDPYPFGQLMGMKWFCQADPSGLGSLKVGNLQESGLPAPRLGASAGKRGAGKGWLDGWCQQAVSFRRRSWERTGHGRAQGRSRISALSPFSDQRFSQIQERGQTTGSWLWYGSSRGTILLTSK